MAVFCKIDGQNYETLADVPDYGAKTDCYSVENDGRRNLIGESSAVSKLPTKTHGHQIPVMSTFLCYDTSEVYSYVATCDEWMKL